MIGHWILPVITVCCSVLLCPGCSDDAGKKGDYKGVGKLVADRNEARMVNAADKKQRDAGAGEDIPAVKRQSKSTEVIIEEDVSIVSDVSGRTIASATAFLDKNGKIINIRIKRE